MVDQKALLLPAHSEILRATDIGSSLRIISYVTVVMVVLLALGSFVLSFEALWEFAASSGAIAPSRSWIFPLVVDGSIIVFSISALRSSIAKENGRWQMSLVVVATLFSMLFNVAHAPGGFMTGLVAVMPPLLLFLSFESLMRQLKSSLAVELKTTSSLVQGTHQQKKLLKNQKAKTLASGNIAETRRIDAVRLLREGMAKRAVAKQLGLSVTTVRRLATRMAA